MLYMVRFDITQPASMSTDQLWEVWHQEAIAALGAKEAGAVVDLWKVAGERVVFALCDFPDGDALDRALASLRSRRRSAPARRRRAGRCIRTSSSPPSCARPRRTARPRPRRHSQGG